MRHAKQRREQRANGALLLGEEAQRRLPREVPAPAQPDGRCHALRQRAHVVAVAEAVQAAWGGRAQARVLRCIEGPVRGLAVRRRARVREVRRVQAQPRRARRREMHAQQPLGGAAVVGEA
eukprot:1320428-Rhodomonas_salina.1